MMEKMSYEEKLKQTHKRQKMLTNERHRKNRRLVLIHYSINDDPPSCTCCGEFTYELLAIDHKLPKDQYPLEAQVHGYDLVVWIIKNDFPPMFQILCHNCNYGKYRYGSCPHKWINQKQIEITNQ